MKVIEYRDKYRDDMIYMVLSAKDALGRVPRLNNDLLDVYSNYIECGDKFWIAVDDSDRVIGCLGYNRLSSGPAKLHRFYVKPAMKGKGIGTALLNTCEEYLSGHGIREIVAHLGDLYNEAKGFYEKKGYFEYQPTWFKKII